jgi:acetyl-CoA C-acetyltransferase
MGERVGICAVAQTAYVRRNTTQRFQAMAWEVVESLLAQTGLDFSEDGGIGTAVSVSDDVYDARTISDNAMTDVLGAHYRCEEKVAQDGAQAVAYATATILSGHADLVLVVGHCKESQAESRNQVTHLAFDPFYTRPVGLDFLCAAGLQAQAYMARSRLTESHLARIVARARRLAATNPAHRDLAPVTEDEVSRSPLLADPLRELHCHPVSDGAVGLILASEARARALTRTPVWVTGVGCSMDSFFLGDRDLGESEALRAAAARAYRRAGLADPAREIDLVEVSDPYAHQMPMWLEGLGLCPERGGGRFVEDGGPDRGHVNLSGGTLAGGPVLLGGLSRVAEAALQLSGRAGGGRQLANPRRALAHGTTGPAGQHHSVVILEAE